MHRVEGMLDARRKMRNTVGDCPRTCPVRSATDPVCPDYQVDGTFIQDWFGDSREAQYYCPVLARQQPVDPGTPDANGSALAPIVDVGNFSECPGTDCFGLAALVGRPH